MPTIVALVGNPNVGKTALFNALTGFRRHVANYPGVTVDVARGPVHAAGRSLELIDLPGTYSLAATAPDEELLCRMIGADAPNRPGLILAILDASNLPRNLYLLSQILELGVPVVVALNMVDVAKARGIEVDVARLSRRLGVPVVPVVATDERTIEPLRAVLADADLKPPPTPAIELPPALGSEVANLSEASGLARAECLRVIADAGGCAERRYASEGRDMERVREARERLRAAGIDPGLAEARVRYAWISELLPNVMRRRVVAESRWLRAMDGLITHRVGGVVVLLAMLYGLFYAIYSFAQYPMLAIEWLLAQVGQRLAAVLPDGMLESLVVDGVIGGVGGVLTFLPQILILFMLLAVLEDCGYLARVAFMVDRLMRPVGLSGRSFIPLLSAFACAVPAIMGTRSIGDRKERILTILLIPFMSCSARLPVYVLLIGAFVPPVQWLGGWLRLDALVMLGMYMLGVLMAFPVALLLRRTALRGPGAAFLLELPGYRLPRWRTVWQRMSMAGRSFIVRAGSIILLVNIVVWALGYFPRSTNTAAAVAVASRASGWDESTHATELEAAYLRESYLGRMGRAIEPAIRPLGWDWRIGVGVLAAFPARELIIATLGTLSNLGDAADDGVALQEAVQRLRRDDTGEPVFTLPVALSVMVFFALCAQCGATLVMIGRETRSWTWPLVVFVGMTLLAYVCAWAAYAGTSALGW